MDLQKSNTILFFLFYFILQSLCFFNRQSILATFFTGGHSERQPSKFWSLLRLMQSSPAQVMLLTVSSPFSLRPSAITASWAISWDQCGWEKINVKDVYFRIAGESVLVGKLLWPILRNREKGWASEREREREGGREGGKDDSLDGYAEPRQNRITIWFKTLEEGVCSGESTENNTVTNMEMLQRDTDDQEGK